MYVIWKNILYFYILKNKNVQPDVPKSTQPEFHQVGSNSFYVEKKLTKGYVDHIYTVQIFSQISLSRISLMHALDSHARVELQIIYHAYNSPPRILFLEMIVYTNPNVFN